MKIAKSLRPFLFLFFSLFISSCTWFYFQSISSPTQALHYASLIDLPYRELWSGFVFNGEKIGFSRMRITALDGEDTSLVESEAHFRIRFLGVDKQISLKSRDSLRPDLTLVSFEYEIKMDQKLWNITGEVKERKFRATVKTGDLIKVIEKSLEEPLYPVSAVNLWPLLRGVTVGADYRFLVFDPQTQTFAEVSQKVTAFEKSERLRVEPSYKFETEMLGHQVATWINLRGEAILEMALGGVLITYKEEEETAKRFLSEATLNKKDIIIDFSLVKTNQSIPCPKETTFLEVTLEGLLEQLSLLQGPGQEAMELRRNGKRLALFRLRSEPGNPARIVSGFFTEADLTVHLSPTVHLESDHPEIRNKAQEVIHGLTTPMEKVRRLVKWVSEEVQDEAVDSLSALEVLRTLKGECQAHTMLYVAMARAVGIPTRLVGGLTYGEGMGFLYHAWAESYVEGWIAVDPTFDQVGVDATHIKIVEGPSWASLIPIGKVVGRIKAVIHEYQASCWPKRG
jgi:hypothetical protein